MKFESKYYVGIKDIGVNNKITNVAILGFLEEIGCAHSATCGYGVNDIETNKKAWLIMDWKLKVLERPKYGDEITIKTWSRPIEKHIFYTYRDFEVFNGGKKVAVATSKWILFDIESKKISKITDDIISLYKSEDTKVFEEKELPRLKEIDDFSTQLEYKVRRLDIDVNQHMHNLNYLKLAYEVLPENVYYEEEKSNVRIMYKKQILLGDTVNCYYTELEGKQIVTIKNKENTSLHAIIELN